MTKSVFKGMWEEEYKKCIASPYYFAVNYLTIVGNDGIKRPFVTNLSEEEFNKQFNYDNLNNSK